MVDMHEELCLEFANTVHWHASDQPYETLHNYEGLLGWLQKEEIIEKERAAQLSELAKKSPLDAEEVFGRSIELREAIYRVLRDHVHGSEANRIDLGRIRTELGEALVNAQLEPEVESFNWKWGSGKPILGEVIAPIASSITDLLTSPVLLPRVGQCADERGCGWLFLDFSKNHKRRWCDINDCGNVAKQRRHRSRKPDPATGE